MENIIVNAVHLRNPYELSLGKEEKMSEIISFIQNHWDELLAIIGGVVSVASIIVKLTPTTKDDNVLNTIINFLAKLSIVNTSLDQKKIDNAK